MAWTKAQADDLRAKIALLASGAMQSISFADQTYTFMDLDKLRSLLASMEHDVAAAEGRHYRVAATSKGV